MSMIQVRDCKTAAEVFANYRAVRARIKAIAPPQKPPNLDFLADDFLVVPELEAEPEKTWCLPAIQHPVTTIVALVSALYRVTPGFILSERRNFKVARPRQIAMYLARAWTSCSDTEIGRRLGGRDHSTVDHGIQRIAAQRLQDRELADELTWLEGQLGATS